MKEKKENVNYDFFKGIKTCQSLPNCPKISEDVIKKSQISVIDILRAYQDIEKRRIDDNKSWFYKIFIKKFKK